MKKNKKYDYKKEERKQRVLKTLKWVAVGVGWTGLLLSFCFMIALQCRSCAQKQGKKQDEVQEVQRINQDVQAPWIDEPNNQVLTVDYDGGIYSVDYTYNAELMDFMGAYEIGERNPYQDYLTWAEYDFMGLRNDTSWLHLNEFKLENYFVNGNNASNHYLGGPAPLCDLTAVISVYDKAQDVTTQYTWKVNEISCIHYDVYYSRLEFIHIRNHNYDLKLNINSFRLAGYDDGNFVYRVQSLNVAFYRFLTADFNAYNDQPLGAPWDYMTLLSWNTDGFDVMDFFSQNFYCTKYFILTDLRDFFPGGSDMINFHILDNNSTAQKYKLPYYSTNPQTVVYALGVPPIGWGENGGGGVGGDIGSTDNAFANVFGLLGMAFSALSKLFTFEIIPGVSLWVLISIPLTLMAVMFIVWMFKR